MDIPSLFMIPSAVSSGKVHSVFPNSTDADFDFARSSTASRVKSDGLIETVASGQARLNYEIEGLHEIQMSHFEAYIFQYLLDLLVINLA